MTEEHETKTVEDISIAQKPAVVIKPKAVVWIAFFLLSVVAVTGTIMFAIFYLNFNIGQNA